MIADMFTSYPCPSCCGTGLTCPTCANDPCETCEGAGEIFEDDNE